MDINGWCLLLTGSASDFCGVSKRELRGWGVLPDMGATLSGSLSLVATKAGFVLLRLRVDYLFVLSQETEET
eukprot:1581663-Ditylum_brightwellii.AAC.1